MGMNGLDLYELPEGCIANIVSLTTPPDACRVSLVCSLFRSAAESDAVWERFLPSDYQSIINRSDASSSLAFDLKKHLYLRLSNNPLLIDGGTKSFSLDKWSGKKCYMIAARELTIVWGDTPNYWVWLSKPESRFSEVAELQSVCWLEIRGKINTGMLSPGTKYAAYFVYKLTESTHGFYQPVEVSVDSLGGDSGVRNVYLDPSGGPGRREYPAVPWHVGRPGRGQHHVSASRSREPPLSERDGRYPIERVDGWMEIELGEYVNEGGENEELEMSLVEVKAGNWKGGLIVQGIEIRPKEG